MYLFCMFFVHFDYYENRMNYENFRVNYPKTSSKELQPVVLPFLHNQKKPLRRKNLAATRFKSVSASSVCRIRGKRLVGAYRLEKRGLAGRGGDWWFLEDHHRADRVCQREQRKEGKEDVFAQRHESDYSKNIEFIPTKVRNPPQETG